MISMSFCDFSQSVKNFSECFVPDLLLCSLRALNMGFKLENYKNNFRPTK